MKIPKNKTNRSAALTVRLEYNGVYSTSKAFGIGNGSMASLRMRVCPQNVTEGVSQRLPASLSQRRSINIALRCDDNGIMRWACDVTETKCAVWDLPNCAFFESAAILYL